MQEPIIKLNGWQTIKDYAKANGLTTQTVSNRIKRNYKGLEVRVIPELNNLKLVKSPSKQPTQSQS